MQPDPVVAEIRKIREELAAKFDFDVNALVKYAQGRDAIGDRLVVRRPRRPAVQLPDLPAKTA